jgi:hypothetical protein
VPAVAALVLIACVQGASVLLLVAGRRHQRDRRELVHHLGRHGILSRRAARVVSRALPVASIAVGAAVLALPTITVLFAPAAWSVVQRVMAGLEALLYLAFLGYLAVLQRRAPGLNCGCLGAGDERTDRSIARAGVIVAAAVLIAAGLPLAKATTVTGWPALYLLATAVGAFAGALAAGLPDQRRGIEQKGGWPA